MASGDEKQTGGTEDNEGKPPVRSIRWETALGCWAVSLMDMSIRERP
jgi:hypothetical protein